MSQNRTKAYSLEDISDDILQHREAEAFLKTFTQVAGDRIPWLQRFHAWWQTNPACAPDLPRGWLLRQGSSVVGFNGVIAFDYALRGARHKALAMSTWMVHPDHRAQSMKLFLKFHALRKDFMLVNTTANNDVRKVFHLMKYQCAPDLHSFIFFIKPDHFSPQGMAIGAARLVCNAPLRGPVPHRIIGANGLGVMTGALREDDGKLTRRASLAHVQWLSQCPSTHEKEFVGAVDERGELTAYLLFLKHRFRNSLPYLSVIDAYWRDDTSALLGLVRHICDHPESSPLARGCAFIALNSFAPQELFLQTPWACIHRQSFTPHYFHLPPKLAGVPKHCCLAEGDIGC